MHPTDTAFSAPRARTSLSEQMDRLTMLVDHAGRNAQRAYEAASALNGPFPTPGEAANEADQPYGRVDTIRSMLDELERRLGSIGFALGEIESALSPQVKSSGEKAPSGGW